MLWVLRKRLTEIILQSKGNKYKTKFAAVRFGNVLGSNGSVIPIFKEQIKKVDLSQLHIEILFVIS